MQYSALALAVAVGALAQQQGAPSGLAPPGGIPSGCSMNGNGWYEVQNVQPMAKRDVLMPRYVACDFSGSALFVEITNGELHDSKGRIGEIVANNQFQFDGPPAQAGTLYDAGWSICANNSLAIGPSTTFYQCQSGRPASEGGNFYNIYNKPVGSNCIEINQQLLQCVPGTSPSGTSGVVSTMASTSTVAASSSSAAVTTSAPIVANTTMSISTATSSVAVVSQTSDGQPQASSATTKAPIPTGAASQFAASGAVAVVGAFAAFFL